MAQVAVSIRQSLTQALPVYDYFGKNHTPPQPGSFTGLTLPPSFGILRNQADRWVHRGQQYLATLPPKWAAAQQLLNQPGLTPAQIAEIQETVNSARIFANNQEFIPGREANINHHNEADIVRTASLYLLHPVGQALWSDPDFNRAFYSRVEDVASDTRADVTFYRNDPNGPRSFAVVEFKRRTVVDGHDFSHNTELRAPANAS